MKILQSAALAATLASSTLAALSTFSPLSADGPTYSYGIPSSSSISASSKGDIYLQIRAPTSFTWAAFGIGQRMAGARIFVMYSDGQGNVTLSARKGTGNVQPQNNQDLQSGVVLLAGSGIVNGEMVANIKVSSTNLESDKSSTSSSFIAAWMPGAAIDSTSPTATIRQHARNAYRQLSLDLSQAQLSSNSNPFIGGGSGKGSSSTGSASNPSSTSGGGGAAVVGTSGDELATYQKAHGIVMAVAVVLLFPLGAVFIRMGGSMIGHATVQMLALLSMIVGFGLGVKLANITDYLFNTAHTIIGTALLAGFLIQPLLGVAHHLNYRKYHSRTPVSFVHIWFGRSILALGIVNGGLGLKLAANTRSGEIAYGIAAAVVSAVYIALAAFKRKGGAKNGGRGRKKMSGVGSEEIRLHDVRGGREMESAGYGDGGSGQLKGGAYSDTAYAPAPGGGNGREGYMDRP